MNEYQKNQVQLVGHLGNDVQIVEFGKGNKKASFSLAVNSSYTMTSGETKKETSWFTIVAWGKTADSMEEMLKKGNEVGIEGKVVNRKYVDKSGNSRYIFEIVASRFSLLEKSEKQAVEV
ncbi:MAG: single-stranded DNA-binding protein [Saprospiraceae bacterium]|nr:single-stranded DNA-binding protein [Saprospiraceae bacterium]